MNGTLLNVLVNVRTNLCAVQELSGTTTSVNVFKYFKTAFFNTFERTI